MNLFLSLFFYYFVVIVYSRRSDEVHVPRDYLISLDEAIDKGIIDSYINDITDP